MNDLLFRLWVKWRVRRWIRDFQKTQGERP
jgi:hypothetical protein